MSLSDRIQEVQKLGPTARDHDTVGQRSGVEIIDLTSGTDNDPFFRIKLQAQDKLFAQIGQRLYEANLSEAELAAMVRAELDSVLQTMGAPLDADERQALIQQISNDVLGLGPIERFLADESVTEIMVNSTHNIHVERAGRLEMTHARYLSDEHLRQVIERIVGQVGRRVDESSPMVDARLLDGSRVNAIVPPLAVDGPALTIRKFGTKVLGVAELVELNSMTREVADFLESCVLGKLNILVSGGTGTGKTTMLNALSSFIPETERIVTIEDAVELQLDQRHVIRLESRPPNIEGKGEYTIRDLVRNSLRMRPDRIIVGEVRGGEALDMLQAMNTGHEGSLSTLHANSARDALSRLETMVLMSGLELPIRAIREQVVSALDLIVQISRMRDGSRRVTSVTEVEGMEGDTITLSDLFRYEARPHEGVHSGGLVACGLRPRFSDRLADVGLELPASLFGATDVQSLLDSSAGHRDGRR